MQFDWMVQCYPGDGVFRDAPLLGALAERTDDVDLGPLVGSITYRNPALLAKMATTVDLLSEGRVRLGLGAGWHEAYPDHGGIHLFGDEVLPELV